MDPAWFEAQSLSQQAGTFEQSATLTDYWDVFHQIQWHYTMPLSCGDSIKHK